MTISLAGGGAERSVTVLSKMLAALGHEIHIVSLTDEIAYDYEGKLLNLGLLKKKNRFIGTLKSFGVFKKYLKSHEIDVIIDNRTRPSFLKEWIYLKYIYKSIPTILVVRSYHLGMYFPRFAESIYKNVTKIIGVSQAIAAEVVQRYGLSQTQHIYNAIPVLKEETLTIKLPSDYILSYGRIVDEVKNFKLLLSAFAKAKITTSLVIMGDGPDVAMLKAYASQLEIQKMVLFIPNQKAPRSIIKNAQFVTLTSRYEGFPMVLVEALSLGVPVVSVDCASGPSELIKKDINGILVPEADENALVEALKTMALDDTLRVSYAEQAVQSVAHLDPDQIAQEWQKLLSSV